jgi:hypothetical protein
VCEVGVGVSRGLVAGGGGAPWHQATSHPYTPRAHAPPRTWRGAHTTRARTSLRAASTSSNGSAAARDTTWMEHTCSSTWCCVGAWCCGGGVVVCCGGVWCVWRWWCVCVWWWWWWGGGHTGVCVHATCVGNRHTLLPRAHHTPRPPSAPSTPAARTLLCVALSMGSAARATRPSTSTMDSLGMPQAYLTIVFDTVTSSANMMACVPSRVVWWCACGGVRGAGGGGGGGGGGAAAVPRMRACSSTRLPACLPCPALLHTRRRDWGLWRAAAASRRCVPCVVLGGVSGHAHARRRARAHTHTRTHTHTHAPARWRCAAGS